MEAQTACHHLGEFREAAKHATAVLALAPRVPGAERCITILDPVVGSLAESARNLWITGHLTRALMACDEASGAADSPLSADAKEPASDTEWPLVSRCSSWRISK